MILVCIIIHRWVLVANSYKKIKTEVGVISPSHPPYAYVYCILGCMGPIISIQYKIKIHITTKISASSTNKSHLWNTRKKTVPKIMPPSGLSPSPSSPNHVCHRWGNSSATLAVPNWQPAPENRPRIFGRPAETWPPGADCRRAKFAPRPHCRWTNSSSVRVRNRQDWTRGRVQEPRSHRDHQTCRRCRNRFGEDDFGSWLKNYFFNHRWMEGRKEGKKEEIKNRKTGRKAKK